jgi:predicted nucleic acid-binding protein
VAVTDWLIDKSALVRLADSSDAAEWAARIERGLVRIATVTRLEVGYSARSGPDLRAGLRRPPLAAMPVEYQTPTIEDRAVEVLMLLADRGQHRAPSIPALHAAVISWPLTARLPPSTSIRCSRSWLQAETEGLVTADMSSTWRPACGLARDAKRRLAADRAIRRRSGGIADTVICGSS